MCKCAYVCEHVCAPGRGPEVDSPSPTSRQWPPPCCTAVLVLSPHLSALSEPQLPESWYFMDRSPLSCQLLVSGRIELKKARAGLVCPWPVAGAPRVTVSVFLTSQAPAQSSPDTLSWPCNPPGVPMGEVSLDPLHRERGSGSWGEGTARQHWLECAPRCLPTSCGSLGCLPGRLLRLKFQPCLPLAGDGGQVSTSLSLRSRDCKMGVIIMVAFS